MMQAVFAAEVFLQTVSVDDMTRDQLEIHAIRKILDSENVNRRNLPAVPDSFNQIKDVEVISLNMYYNGIIVVPECHPLPAPHPVLTRTMSTSSTGMFVIGDAKAADQDKLNNNDIMQNAILDFE